MGNIFSVIIERHFSEKRSRVKFIRGEKQKVKKMGGFIQTALGQKNVLKKQAREWENHQNWLNYRIYDHRLFLSSSAFFFSNDKMKQPWSTTQVSNDRRFVLIHSVPIWCSLCSLFPSCQIRMNIPLLQGPYQDVGSMRLMLEYIPQPVIKSLLSFCHMLSKTT